MNCPDLDAVVLNMLRAFFFLVFESGYQGHFTTQQYLLAHFLDTLIYFCMQNTSLFYF